MTLKIRQVRGQTVSLYFAEPFVRVLHKHSTVFSLNFFYSSTSLIKGVIYEKSMYMCVGTSDLFAICFSILYAGVKVMYCSICKPACNNVLMPSARPHKMLLHFGCYRLLFAWSRRLVVCLGKDYRRQPFCLTPRKFTLVWLLYY